MNVIRFGTGAEYIEIGVPHMHKGRDWIDIAVSIVVPSFQGSIKASVEPGDFEAFAANLRSLYQSLQGKAEFNNRERQFTLSLAAATGGHVRVTGEAWSHATYGNKLTFVLELDQSYLLSPLRELESLFAHSQSEA